MKNSSPTLITAIVLAAMLAAPAAAADWIVDKAHTTISFSVRHLMLSKVRGTFGDFDGKVIADHKTGRISHAEGVVRVKSIDTNNDKRDAHLLQDDFFNAFQFPLITLKTRSIQWDGNKLKAVADLTIRDITHPVTIEGEYLGMRIADFGDGPRAHAGYSLHTTVNRQDFGLKFAAMMDGAAVVGDEVTVEIDLEIVRALEEDEKQK
jgi:polyisoprenoid-binding protein YceI